ncbi:hypothetical protein ACX93W_06655 [Paenibacillus sp. CAU 1782]
MKQGRVVFLVVKGSTIKKFLIVDLIAGTGIYYVLKIVYSSVIIASAGSFIGTATLKKIGK